ncbi:sedoheptulose 7-phosphate isomerase [Hoylesella saccharolytica F0055]|uniref:Sedoheptulose 7-phosphate isomerase n=1 Tax=Hoylesella saccharolytica F0055 TaxID=1127699 RepID=L1N211_9BACT|nr:D-sedoheptulose 7-phosphate isomerase [Hoylesella saccharolytica]EKX97266.1 sedoheptulose 7-phosphate isomerase [Hoylesella saccharolytica F0055]
MKELIRTSLIEAEQTLASFLADEKTVESIAQAADYCSTSLRNGHKIISCGNGGSLCDATHFAEELTGRYRDNRRPLPALAINDPAYMTCTGNDFSFNDVFSRYIEGVGCDGDVLLAISTSGNSANIVRAAQQAKAQGMKVIALTSKGLNKLAEVADIAICAPKAAHSDRIQEIHIKVIHILIQAIESELGLS